MSKFSLKHTQAGFSFNLVADNGQVVAASQVYAAKDNCLKGIGSVQANAPFAPVEDQTVKDFEAEENPKFEVYSDKAGKFRFRLKAENGEIIAASQGYKAKASCLKGIDSVRLNAAAADIVEEETGADLVVFGKIFTSEDDQLAEAFAVKDGRYIYVGDREGAKAFVKPGRTEVLDYTGKGLVMPSCGNGHAHYFTGHAMPMVGTIVSGQDSVDKFLKEIVPAAVEKAKANGIKTVFGFGWNYHTFSKNMPTRQQLDAISTDIPIYFADEEGHKGLVNTIALVNAGIMKEDGTLLKTEIRGGEIEIGPDGTPTGFLKEQAGTYVRSFLDNDRLFSVETAKETIKTIQDQMLSEGYTMYMDGWSQYFYNDHFYQAAKQVDDAGNLHVILGLSYEIESWMDVDKTLAEAEEVRKYATDHVLTNWVKLFMDGTVEGNTGFVEPLYPDGHQGLVNWTEEETTAITRKANGNGLSMHIHTMGNKAVNQCVNAFVVGGKDEMRNTIVHVRNVDPSDWQRMADHNIYATAGMLWHNMPTGAVEILKTIVPAGMEDKSYPMKSYFDYGINVSSHSDFPALSGCPDDPFGIMEIAVTGVNPAVKGEPWWPDELLTREQVLTALTINCANQLFLEEERGSISEGKYADFLLVDRDVLSCPVDQIHTARPQATYFEGKKVFSR